MHIDPSTTKYLIKASITAGGVVEKPDVVGAIFGHTEGLLGEELDLRELQKNGKIGRIEVEISSRKGKSEGEVFIPSSLDQVETVILASALETIDRVGPCKAEIKIKLVEDVRVAKKKIIAKRAKELLLDLMRDSKTTGESLTDTVRQMVQIHEMVGYGPDNCPAGPNVEESDAIIVVEGRSDVLNLLKYGIKNAVAVEGTNVPNTIIDLCDARVVTAFVDGDRGGELIIKELIQVTDVDFIARAPRAHEVEELTQKQIIKALRNKIPAEQFMEMYGLGGGDNGKGKKPDRGRPDPKKQKRDFRGGERRDERPHPKKKQDDRPKSGQKRLSNQQIEFRNTLNDISGSRKAVILGKDGKTIKETQVSELSNVLTENLADVESVVFDGIITQRLLDQAVEKNIKHVVGNKIGNVTKQPASLEVLTKTDLE